MISEHTLLCLSGWLQKRHGGHERGNSIFQDYSDAIDKTFGRYNTVTQCVAPII